MIYLARWIKRRLGVGLQKLLDSRLLILGGLARGKGRLGKKRRENDYQAIVKD